MLNPKFLFTSTNRGLETMRMVGIGSFVNSIGFLPFSAVISEPGPASSYGGIAQGHLIPSFPADIGFAALFACRMDSP